MQDRKDIGVCTASGVHAQTEHHGYPESLRKRAAEMYVDGGNLRRIARHLKV